MNENNKLIATAEATKISTASGVRWDAESNKWVVEIGRFHNFEDAVRVSTLARRALDKAADERA